MCMQSVYTMVEACVRSEVLHHQSSAANLIPLTLGCLREYLLSCVVVCPAKQPGDSAT